MTADCMICDLYAAIDAELDPDNMYGSHGLDRVAGLVADLVHILPPRGHAFHNLAIWQRTYTTRPLVRLQ